MTAPSATATVEVFEERARQLLPLIREQAPIAEREGRLTPAVVEALYDSGLMRALLVPELGGAGLTLPEIMRVLRIVASGDASTGWNYFFVAGSPVIGQMLPRDRYDEIYKAPRAAIVGALAPNARAVAKDGGFVVSGRASYTSAHVLASHIITGCMVIRDGAPAVTNGVPEMRIAVLPIEQATFLPTWDAAGMRATGSDDAVFENCFVPEDMTFAFPVAFSPWREGAWAKLPVINQLGWGIAYSVVGAARGCIEAFREMSATKTPALSQSKLSESPGAQLALAEAEGLRLAADALIDEGLREQWEIGASGRPPAPDDLVRARLSSLTAARLARRAAETVREHAGMNGALTGSPVDRFCRDIHTMTQHITLQPARFENAGRILMGLPPAGPII